MTDDLNGWRFGRGLDDDFMEKLEIMAKQPGWFADVLADHDLILGIRKNYVNVYRLGQSLFKIERKGKSGALKVSTHPKYLLDPGLSKPVSFDGAAFEVGTIDPLLKRYKGVEALKRMKRAAEPYGGGEKKGLHSIILDNKNVVDTEIAFSCDAENDDEGRYVPRIDLACFEEIKEGIRLRFWEAKLYTNGELRASGDTDAPVVGQVRSYREWLAEHRDDVVKSYRVVAQNLVDIGRWVAPQRNVGELVLRVAEGAPFEIDKSPMVGLLIYGYDDAQKNSKYWKAHIGKLKQETSMPLLLKGDPKKMKLRGPQTD